jgi:hypothetical protein
MKAKDWNGRAMSNLDHEDLAASYKATSDLLVNSDISRKLIADITFERGMGWQAAKDAESKPAASDAKAAWDAYRVSDGRGETDAEVFEAGYAYGARQPQPVNAQLLAACKDAAEWIDEYCSELPVGHGSLRERLRTAVRFAESQPQAPVPGTAASCDWAIVDGLIEACGKARKFLDRIHGASDVKDELDLQLWYAISKARGAQMAAKVMPAESQPQAQPVEQHDHANTQDDEWRESMIRSLVDIRENPHHQDNQSLMIGYMDGIAESLIEIAAALLKGGDTNRG